MTRTRSILGMMLLSALAVCAFGAANAAALTMHECEESFFGTGRQFRDAKCSEEELGGDSETVPIPLGTEVELEGTLTPTTANNQVTVSEKAGTHAVLHAVLGGVEVQITCTGFSTPGAKARNVEEGPMRFTGTSKWKMTGCSMVGGEKAAANCKVPETLESVLLLQTSEVGDKVAFEPKAGGAFITIPFTSKEGKTCPAAIKGEKELTGLARGVAASPTALEFTSASESLLTLGGQEAFFTSVIHFRTKGTTGETGTVALETP